MRELRATLMKAGKYKVKLPAEDPKPWEYEPTESQVNELVAMCGGN
jgi:hypothetical protein